MNIIDYRRIDQLAEEGFNFDISEYFNEGFNIFRKEIGLFIAYTLIYGFIYFVTNMLPFVKYLAGILLSPPLVAGFYLAAYKVSSFQRLDFEDFFKGFEYYGNLILQQFILTMMVVAVFIPVGVMVFLFEDAFIYGDISSGIGIALILASFVAIIIAMYIVVLYVFSQMFILFGDMQAWDAMEASRKIVNRNFWPILGFSLLLIIINFGGMMLCFVGLVFTVPATYAIYYAAFKDLMQLNLSPDQQGYQDDIMDHLVD